MHLIANKYQLLELAETKGIPSVYDLIDKIKPKKGNIACTDGTTIFIDPDEFNKLEPMHQFFILSHELLHIVYRHHEMSKQEFSNRLLLNVCQDIVINEYLAKRLRYKAPDGLYLDNFSDYLIKLGYISGPITYNGTLTTKALYRYLLDFSIYSNFCDLLQKIGKDIIEPSDDTEESTTPQLLKEVCKSFKIDKKMIANEQGKTVKEIEDDIEYEYVEDIEGGEGGKGSGSACTPSKIYSTQEIVKFVKDFIGTNAVIKGRSQTFTRPNRRIQSNDYVLKGYKHTKNIKEITIYLDTSGSMNNQFIADMYNTLSTLYQTTKFRLFEFDTSIREVNLKEDRLYSGGGTNITRVLNHIKDNSFDVSIMITDCEDRFTLDDIKSDLMIFTNNLSFRSRNPKVQVSYFK